MKTIKMYILKPAICLTISLLVISCLNMKNNGYYVKYTGQVEITNAVIPDTVTNMSQTQILVYSMASNGCWKNLKFILTKESDFEYDIAAYGIFESSGSCPEIKVYGDTSITFQPTMTGLYKFYVAKRENETEIDTMIVK
jgi:hypothetical protein